MTETAIGFDTETRPVFVKGDWHPVSLIQLSTPTLAVVCLLEQGGGCSVTPRVAALLADPGTLKVGQGADADARALSTEQEVEVHGVVDLRPITTAMGFQKSSLRALSAVLLGIRVSKGQQMSDWSRRPLTAAQVRYAATDAWASLRVYQELLELDGAEEHVCVKSFPPAPILSLIHI
eukprot:TRINITY_DN49280_c0_g1_i2.p2 TRINITY_DN49280_c0_g1~~TRINITY_DN49280_c0_g1_i2.p2  ORF type:complete len:178 (+),score=39.13 TRINITY_DN49280_c0_g1_i2:427-960(+)